MLLLTGLFAWIVPGPSQVIQNGPGPVTSMMVSLVTRAQWFFMAGEFW
jgi:hypothetical protein